MKRLFYLVLVALGFNALTACSDDDKDEKLEISQEQLTQTAFADETERTITFTATEAWSTEINYKSAETEEEQNWITLSPAAGEAGNATLTITFKVNYSGITRQAVIIIRCGGTETTISVEQDGKTEDGKVPAKEEEPTVPTPNKKLVGKIVMNSENYSEEEKENSEMTFEYDAQNRLVSMTGTTTGEETYDIKDSFTYSENTITYSSVWKIDGYTIEATGIYTLNQDGYVETWKQEEDGEVTEGKITYDANGYFLSSEIWNAESQSKYKEQAEWQDGNLVKVIGSGENNSSTMEYGELPNNANLDFAYLFAQTEWLTCFAFDGSGLKPFGYFGKRSANLPVKESDPEESYYYLYQYESDSEGNIVKVTVTSYDTTNNEVECVTVYTISYIDAQ